MPFMERLKTEGDIYFKIVEIVVLVGGVYFAVSGLQENTAANLTASRSQLYASEAVISSREFDASDSSLQSLYAHPDEALIDPKEYVVARMRALSDDEAVLRARNVSELYEAFAGLNTFGVAEPSRGLVQTRKAFSHLSSIFGVMHSALDYQREAVMSAAELGTWLGYVSDVGPHPLLLTTMWGWHDSRYMSREFAQIVRQRLLDEAPRNRAIIEYFYPQMLAPDFLDALPLYR
jgi:hypothetical protein